MKIAKYLIAGCGQVGAGLARALTLQGHTVTVIDPDPENLERLGAAYAGQRITDSPLDRNVLVSAGIERCDGLAAVFRLDATNIAVALAARRIFRVPRVVARLHQTQLAETYHRMGIQTLCPQRWGVNQLVTLLSRSPFQVITSLGSQLDLVEIRLPPALVGRAVEDLDVDQEIQVVLITRAGKALMAQPGLRFQEGDLVHLMLRESAQDQLRNLLS
jgi:trk system potassium uptake protein TrkA